MSEGLALRLYHRVPVPLQDLSLSVYGLYLQHQRYGGISKAYTRELLSHETWDEERVDALQLELLRDRALLALTQVPAYDGLSRYVEDVRHAGTAASILQVFPVLAKETVRKAPASYVPRSVKGRIHIGHTGGTTGKPLALYRTIDGLRRNFAFFRRMRVWRGVSHWSRTATIMGRLTVPAGAVRPPFWRHSWFTRNLLFSSFHMTPRNLPAYARALVDARPEQVVCYPSSGKQIAAAILRAGLSPRGIKAIFTTAETVSPDQREIMERAFGCPVADQYGSGEWAAVISQCEQGTYHLHPEYGYLEILDASGSPAGAEIGRAVATGFVNDAMVLMRYDTGDLIRASDRACVCGRNFRTIAVIEGRREDVIRTPDGREIGRLNNFAFAEAQGVVEGQLVQTALDEILVRIVPGEEWGSAQEHIVLRALQTRLGADVRIRFEVVPAIERTGSGKFRAVIGLDRHRVSAEVPSH